jgi:hypothetical protein
LSFGKKIVCVEEFMGNFQVEESEKSSLMMMVAW